MDKYEIVETIGTGSFGVVNKAIEKETKNIVALKGINKSNYGSKELKNFHKECSIHAHLCHPNIIRMLESFETPDYIFVVTDFAAIDLHQFLKRRPVPKLTEDHVQLLTGNLISALYYLHSHRILHRDLKPQNILLNEAGMDAKLCDFGLARNMTRETHLLTSIKGTPLYMAPEVMCEQPYDQSADLWSLGCILYEMLVGQPPFKAKSMHHLQNLLQKQPISWPNTSENCSSFLQGLLKKNVKQRFTWPTVLQHPFVDGKLVILDGGTSDSPLTNALTESQTLAKEKQRDEILLKKGKKIIAERAKLCKAQVGTHHQQAAAILAQQQQQQQQQGNATDENTSLSSLDSVHAIVQTDVENIETDVETASVPKSGANTIPENSNLIIQRFPGDFDSTDEPKPKVTETKTDNSNLVIGTMADNLKNDEIDVRMKQLNLGPKDATASRSNVSHNVHQTGAQKQGKNKDLEKRKLRQNLDNFSIRLAGNAVTTSTVIDETPKFSKDKEKEKTIPIVETNVSVSDSPIENEEWLAFIRSSMQEVLSGQIDSLKQQNLVGMIVAILRNVNASSKVIESVVQLLILPLVLPVSIVDMTEIENTYVQTKILPNLIFASKLICKLKPINQSHSSNASSNSESLQRTMANKPIYVFVKMNELSSDQLSTLLRIYELTCHLVHMNDQFLTQFCESIMIIASDLFVHILSNATGHPLLIQLTSVIVAMLCYTLREVPENAEHIEKIIFHESVNLVPLLKCGNPMLKARVCMLLRIVGRFSCFALQNAWTTEMKEALEALTTDEDDTVQERAKSTIDEFSYFSFYNNAQKANCQV